MIEVKNLTVAFGEKTILENISTKFIKNKITVVAGQSGTGKSVLMKTIERMIIPSSGKVLIDGIDIFSLSNKDLKKIRMKISMLFQSSALLDSLNVFQNVALPIFEHTNKNENEILKIVKEKLELVGLKDILEKMPSELSGGMRKRVALARAIALEPECIIYDEPTTGLDPLIALEIVKLISKMQKHLNITSIVITHDLDCIDKIAENVVMLNNGKICFDGFYKDFKNSENSFIKKFLFQYRYL